MDLTDATLLFVYADENNFIASLREGPRKCCDKPDGCESCALSVDIGSRGAWRRFLAELRVPVRFLSPDELKARHKTLWERFPVVFVEKGGKLEALLTPSEIAECKNITELMRAMDKKLR